jgi:hypothetical protein
MLIHCFPGSIYWSGKDDIHAGWPGAFDEGQGCLAAKYEKWSTVKRNST